MSGMQRVGKQVGNFLCTHNDRDGTVAKRAEEGASDVRGLRARDGGGITGSIVGKAIPHMWNIDH